MGAPLRIVNLVKGPIASGMKLEDQFGRLRESKYPVTESVRWLPDGLGDIGRRLRDTLSGNPALAIDVTCQEIWCDHRSEFWQPPA